MHSNRSVPILSICIPTYNRSRLLNQLLKQIYDLNEITKSKIELCVSDNFSTDNTPDIIDRWQQKLDLITVRQASNIGGSRNFQAVAALSTSPWVLLMGDDDHLSVPGFETLLALLETLNPNTWILADICNQDGTTLLEKFPSEYLSMRGFKKQILINSALDVLGFMSMHVIPRESARRFALLSLDQIYGWPHLALLFYDLSNVNIYVQRESIVKRGGDGEEVTQTWRANDWLRLMMQKTKLCCNNADNGKIFNALLAFKEYIRWAFIRQVFASKLEMQENEKIFASALIYIKETNIYASAKWVLIIFLFFVLLIPCRVISWARQFFKKSRVSNAFPDRIAETDGMKRGL